MSPQRQANTAPVDHVVLYPSRSTKVPCSFVPPSSPVAPPVCPAPPPEGLREGAARDQARGLVAERVAHRSVRSQRSALPALLPAGPGGLRDDPRGPRLGPPRRRSGAGGRHPRNWPPSACRPCRPCPAWTMHHRRPCRLARDLGAAGRRIHRPVSGSCWPASWRRIQSCTSPAVMLPMVAGMTACRSRRVPVGVDAKKARPVCAGRALIIKGE